MQLDRQLMKPWIVSYAPKNSSNIPQPAIRQLAEFLSNFGKTKEKGKKAVLLYGPSGTCKTIAVHSLAKEMNKELVEINASDSRNAEQIEQRLGSALHQKSLFYDSKIVLVDEVDGVSGQKDRGGITTLAALLKDTTFPIIMTCNDPWDDKLSPLRKLSFLIEFAQISPAEVYRILQEIVQKENVKFDELALKSLSRRCAGDLRGAIIDLQSLAASGAITREIVDQLGERDREEDMTLALPRVLRHTDITITRDAFSHVNENLDEAFFWLEENMPREYTTATARNNAWEYLSRADVFRGRIRRMQHWRFLSYVNDLLTVGVSIAKETPLHTQITYKKPERLLKMWMSKKAARQSIAEKVAIFCHTSKRRALQDIVPYLSRMATKFQVADLLELEEEEKEFLLR